MFRELWTDIWYACRLMVRNPSFAAIVIFTLALGIGGSTSVFSVADALLLRPLPYGEPDQLMEVWNQLPAQGLPKLWLSPPEFLDYRREQQSLSAIGVYAIGGRNLTGLGEPVRISIAVVSAETLPMLRVSPQFGRLFTPEEDLPERNLVVVLEQGFWHRQFGGDKSIVGKTIALNGRNHEIIGVMPAGFHFPPGKVDLWKPIGIDTANPGSRGNHFLQSIARLKPGVSMAQAGQDLNRVAKQMKEKYPNNYRDPQWGTFLQPLREAFVGDTRTPLLVLLGAVSFVLLVACANVANLMLARAAARQREMAVRAALGCSPMRIMRQLLTESAIFGLAGGALGILIAIVGIPALLVLAKDRVPQGVVVGLDWRVLGFAAVTSVFTGLLFGLTPALQSSRPDLHDALKEGGRGGTGGRRRWLRNGLVVSEVALALVLLVGAGLLLRSFSQLHLVDLGYRVARVTSFRLSLPAARYPRPEQYATFFNQALERIRALPGVESAGAISELPLSDAYSSGSVFVEDLPPTQPNFSAGFFESDVRQVTPGYFQTVGMKLLRGRFLQDSDTAKSPLVAVVDDEFARRSWPNVSDPIGRHVAVNQGPDGKLIWCTVVGIVQHVKQYDPATPGREQSYFPYEQYPFADQTLFVVLRAAGETSAIVAAARKEINALDSELPLYDVSTMATRLDESMSLERLNLFLLSAFSLTAMALAAVGIYGVLSYLVTQQTREIGVRRALGAQTGDVLRLVLRQGLTMAVIGITMGVGIGLALTRVMRALLFGVSPTDVPTFAGVSLLLLAVALLACWIPARRAARVDPMTALRYE